MPESTADQVEAVCSDDDYYYFVHGAALGDGESFLKVDPERGGGDFGKGFYTFKLCGDDHALALTKAREHASNKCKTPRSPEGQSSSRHRSTKRPFLILLKMTKSKYGYLSRFDCPPRSEYELELYSAHYRFGETDRQLLIGKVLMNDGRKFIPKIPRQYKFEGADAVKDLEVIDRKAIDNGQ